MIKALLAAAAAACCMTTTAFAQADYPTRPVRMIVPFAAGGGSNSLARIWADWLTRDIGQTFAVENVGGAGGTIGISQVARSTPDGYTILCVTPSITVLPHLQKEVGYTIADFAPVIQTTTSPAVLVVKSNSPIKSVQDVIDLAKSKPNGVLYGTAGIGSFAHLSTELFAAKTKTQLKHVPYKGTGPALVDLIGGTLQVQFENAPGILGQVRSGELRAIAVGTAKKSSILPDLPTIGETVPGYKSSSWFGIMVPAKTPRPIIDKLNASLNKGLADPDVQKKLAGLGVDRVGGTPEQFGEYAKMKAAEAADLAKSANLQQQ